MSQNNSTSSKKAGLPPGALVHIGEQKAGEVRISVIDYTNDDFEEWDCKSIEDSFAFKERDSISWINIDGLHHIDIIEKAGKHFELHPLLVEDILNTHHRPKIEDFDNCIFLTLKMLGISEDGKSIVSEQVSFVLGDHWLLSFQEQQGDIFDNLRQRLRDHKGIARTQGTDYLFYRLIDTIVDNYFFVTEYFSEATIELEEKVLHGNLDEVLEEIQRLKRMIMHFRKSVVPLREAIGMVQKFDYPLIKTTTNRYLHDVYEHIIQINDNIENQREMLASIMDLYLSGVSNKMNRVMQVLTIMASIFIPLTFIAGVYGMNFDNIPELHYKYGYHTVWGIMIIVTAFMIYFFNKKKWL